MSKQILALSGSIPHAFRSAGQTPVCMPSAEDIEDIVRRAAQLASRGTVLRRDFALRADGGKVVPSLTSSLVDHARSRGSPDALGPDVVIDEDLSIGRCWSIPVTGQIGLSSPTLIHPTSISVDHIPKELAADIGRAPRRMILWGLVDGLSNLQRFRSVPTDELKAIANGRTSPTLSKNHAFVPLASFEYDINADFHVQTFPVHEYVAQLAMDFGVFVVEILDNWGSSDSCLYRVRIHGTPAVVNSPR
ncbi:SUN domain-containing protein 3 [Trametes pubescens]|uniref:SUN domain-containing protein 3 n=1 Tax=Trametes pubescens TaxID=154538 RepID=A0A1M2W6A4_TRAPU|nr:SUN domain-containing protein 3 [Trametes pubescens]